MHNSSLLLTDGVAAQPDVAEVGEVSDAFGQGGEMIEGDVEVRQLCVR